MAFIKPTAQNKANPQDPQTYVTQGTQRTGKLNHPLVEVELVEYAAPVAIAAVGIFGSLGIVFGSQETRPYDALLLGVAIGTGAIYPSFTQNKKTLENQVAKLVAVRIELETKIKEFKVIIEAKEAELNQIPKLQEEANQGLLAYRDAERRAIETSQYLAVIQGELERLESQHVKDVAVLETTLFELSTLVDLATDEAQDLADEMATQFQETSERITEYSGETESLIEELNGEIESLTTEVASFPLRLESAIAAGKSENRTLREQLDRCTNSLSELVKPRRLSGSSHSTTVANRVIECLMLRGLTCDPETLEDHGNLFNLYLKPRTGTLKELESLTDAIALDLGLREEPTATLENGMVKLTIVHSPAPEAKTSKEPKESKESKDGSLTWLPEAIMKTVKGKTRPVHLKIAGETESGKSTLVKNAIDLFQAQVPGLTIKLGDPLYHTGESDWEDWEPAATDDESTFELLRDWADEVQARTDDGNRPQPPTLVVIDDIDTLAADFNDPKEDLPVTKAVQKIFKRGRHVGVWLLLIGQSAYSSELKIKIGDLRNATTICIGTTIPKGLQNSQLDSTRETKWLSRYYDLQQQGHRFIAWVDPSQTPGFIALLPDPNAYATQVEESDREIKLLTEGKSIADVIKELYGVSPSRSDAYKAHKARIENKRKSLVLNSH